MFTIRTYEKFDFVFELEDASQLEQDITEDI